MVRSANGYCAVINKKNDMKGAFMKANKMLWTVVILFIILAGCSKKTTGPGLPPTDNFSDFWNFYEYDVILITNPEGPYFNVLTTRETMFDEDLSVKVNGEEAMFAGSGGLTFLGQSLRDYSFEKELVPGEEYHFEIKFLGKTYTGNLEIAYVLSLIDYPDPYELNQPGTFGWHLEDDNQKLFMEYQAQLPINDEDLFMGPFVVKSVSPSLRSYTIPANTFTGYMSIGFYLESLNFTQGKDFMLFSRQYVGVQYFVDYGARSSSVEAVMSATPTEDISKKSSNIERIFELMQLLKEQE